MKSWYASQPVEQQAPSLETALQCYRGSSLTTTALRDAAVCFGEHEAQYGAYRAQVEQSAVVGDSKALLRVVETTKPLLALIDTFAVVPESAEQYVRTQLAVAKEFKETLCVAAKGMGAKLDERLLSAAKQESRAKTVEHYAAVREGKEDIVADYAVLKSFGCCSREAEAYLAAKPVRERLLSSLDGIGELLSREPSDYVVGQVRHKRAYVQSGVFVDGSLRKACKKQGFTEGVLRCDALVAEIDAYLANPSVVQTELALVRSQNDDVRKYNVQIASFVGAKKATTTWLSLLDVSYVPVSARFGAFLQRETARLVKENERLLKTVSERQYVLAQKELGAMSLQRGKTVHAERVQIEKLMRRTGELSQIFVALDAPERSRCEEKRAELAREYVSRKNVAVKEADVGRVGLPYRTFFAAVSELPVPVAPELRELQTKMREGTTQKRLTTLVLAAEKGIRAQGSDRIWMQRFQSHFELDACNGYLAQIASSERLVRINDALRKAWA